MASTQFEIKPLLDRHNSMNTHKPLTLSGAPYANTVLRIASYGLLATLIASQWVQVVSATTDALITLIVHIGLWLISISANLPTPITVASSAVSALVALATLLAPSQWLKGMPDYAPVFLQWSSRGFIDLALIISVCSLYLAFAQVIAGGSVRMSSVGVVHAALLAVLAFAALRASTEQNMQVYQAHALRLFLTVSGLWVTTATNAVALGDALSWPNLPSDAAQASAGLIFSVVGLGVFELYRATRRSNAPANQIMLSLSMVILAALLIRFAF